ncbi:MAG: carboxynorspermidine decarboxylase [Candidatus Marinamargulisbacteria bacterium]
MTFPWINSVSSLPTPTYLIDKSKLHANTDVIDRITTATNCQVILALKGFATWHTFRWLRDHLHGVTASSIYEARLGVEEFKRSVHVHSVAMHPKECAQYNALADHITFNSIHQWRQFTTNVPTVSARLGLRINPGVGHAPTQKYDPCSPMSRLGIPMATLAPSLLSKIDGLHFHALCEQNLPPLRIILDAIEDYFGDHLHQLSWMNWGGGHLLTDADYAVSDLIELIQRWQSTYGLRVILEPGEAIGRHCGYYVGTVLDIIHNDVPTLICDVSITAHMPDVLEYPYTPDILNAVASGPHTYYIGGNTCLAGDVMGPYHFNAPVRIGDPLVFLDMGHYTLVKTSNFNGVNQPSIGIIHEDQTIRMVSESCYFNFKERLS